VASRNGSQNLRRDRKLKRRERRKASKGRSKTAAASKSFAAFDKQVDEIVQGYFDKPPPSPLHHYTDWAGAAGIIGSQRFWATAHDCTNDLGELVTGDPAATAVATELRGQASDMAARTVLDTFLAYHEGNRVSRMIPIYLTCFSAAGHIPEQWRDYADEGRGLCLAIKVIHSESPDDRTLGRNTFSVDYEDQSWKTTLRDGLSRIVEALSTFAKQWKGDPRPAYAAALNGMYRVAAFTSMTAKESNWACEREWRHVAFPRLGVEIPPKHRKSREGRDIKYIELAMRKDGQRIAFEKIILGPAQDGSQAKIRIREILLAAGYGEATPEWPEITVSESAVAPKRVHVRQA
jgi:hypothetical protein